MAKSDGLLQSSHFQLGIILFTVSGILFTLVQVKHETLILSPALPGSIFSDLLILAYVLFAAGVVALLYALARYVPAFSFLRRLFREAKERRGDKTYEHQPSSNQDLHKIYEIGTEVFGRVTPLGEMEKIQARNGRVFWSIRANDRRGNSYVVGYFMLVPLSRGGCNEVELGRLTGLNMVAADVQKTFRHAKGIYIGAVVGTTWYARSFALTKLKDELSRYEQRQIPFYARPATADGQRIMEAANFKTIRDCPDGLQICCRR